MTVIHIGHGSVACPLWYIFIFLISIHILDLIIYLRSTSTLRTCAFHSANGTSLILAFACHYFCFQFLPLKTSVYCRCLIWSTQGMKNQTRLKATFISERMNCSCLTRLRFRRDLLITSKTQLHQTNLGLMSCNCVY